MAQISDNLKSLHTTLIDSRNGYEEALEDAEGKGLTPLFRDMIELRDKHIEQLARILRSAGETAENDGSFMSTVHRTVISVRSLFGGLDESVLPGLIDGEERVLADYDKAIHSSTVDRAEYSTLVAQRQAVMDKVEDMRLRRTAATVE